jgi:hypothetical protein
MIAAGDQMKKPITTSLPLMAYLLLLSPAELTKKSKPKGRLR